MEEIKERNETLSWAIFIGSMFIGMGIGSIYDQAGVGTLIGMGVGYIAEGIIEARAKSNSKSNITG